MWPFDRTLTETFQKPSLCLRAQRSYTSRPKSSPTDNRIWHNTPSEAPTQRDPWSTRQHGEPQHQTLQKVTKKLHITKKLHSHVTFMFVLVSSCGQPIFFQIPGVSVPEVTRKKLPRSYRKVTGTFGGVGFPSVSYPGEGWPEGSEGRWRPSGWAGLGFPHSSHPRTLCSLHIPSSSPSSSPCRSLRKHPTLRQSSHGRAPSGLTY